MSIVTKLGFTLVSLLLLVSIGAPTVIKLGEKLISFSSIRDHQYTVQIVEEAIPDSLDVVSGDDILGMVLTALDGELVLILDGVKIEEDTDMDYVNLSGVVGAPYKLTVDQSGEVPLVVAEIRR